MTIRTVSFTGILLAGLAAPCLAQEATLPPHSLDFDKSVEPESIVIQDLSGGVGSQDGGGGGGGNVIQIMQIQPSGTNGASSSSSAPRYTATSGRSR
jgi:hypothetical protein